MNKTLLNKNIIMLCIGGFISNIGDMMYNLTLTIALYSTSKSITPVAIMFLSRGILRIPMQYIAGILADNFNRKHIITLTNFISVPIALLLILMDSSNLWLGYVVAFLLQSLNDIDVCSETAILPELVEKDQLAQVNSLFSVIGKIAVFASPAFAGLLYNLYGTSIIFIINAITFFIAGIAFSIIQYNPMKTNDNTRLKFASGIEGFKIVKKYTSVVLIFGVMSSFSLLGMMYEVMKISVSDILLNIGEDGIIYFSYALALGGLITPFIVKIISKKKRNGTSIFIYSSLIVSITYIIWSSTKNLYISLSILFVAGIFKSLQGIYSTTVIQKNIPKEFLGRVFSVYKIILTSTAMIGISVSPILHKLVGVSITFLIFSLVGMIFSISALMYIRTIKNRKEKYTAEE